MAGPKYYPILKWKRGEQGAMRHLDVADQSLMLPILEVMGAPGADHRHVLGRQLGDVRAKDYPFGIDGRTLWTPGAGFKPLIKLCGQLQKDGYQAHPVIGVQDLLANLADLSLLKGLPLVVLRLRLQIILLDSVLAAVKAVRKAIGKSAQLHVVFDFGPIGEAPEGGLRVFVEPFVQSTLTAGDANFVAMAGGSFPLSLGGFALGVNNRIRRKEWHVWQDLRQQPGCEEVRFGDFNVTNPEPQEIEDPAKMNPAAAIRYAREGEWWLLKARGAKTSGFGQYNTLCRALVASAEYSGAGFSYGDKRYQFHALNNDKPGNFMTWRRDAASHHLVLTVRRLNQLI